MPASGVCGAHCLQAPPSGRSRPQRGLSDARCAGLRIASSSGGGSGARPPWAAAALLSAVQVVAALHMVVALPAAADDGDFTLRSQPPAGQEQEDDTYFETVPQGLNSADSSNGPRLGSLIEGPKGKQVRAMACLLPDSPILLPCARPAHHQRSCAAQIQQCTRKCVPTCLRGGQGAPGLGPMTMRKETASVVFKDGFRSRQYCLSECVEVCALSIDPPAKPATEAK